MATMRAHATLRRSADWGLIVLAALALGTIGQPALWWRQGDQLVGLTAPDRLGAALTALAATSLLLLRLRPMLGPLLALAMSAIASLSYEALGYPPSPIGLAVLFSVGWVLACCPARHAYPASAAVGAGAVLATYVRPGEFSRESLLAALLMVFLATAIGLVVRAGLGRRDLVRREDAVAADQLRLHASETVLAQRLRIARDMHDSVGHGITLTVLRAETAIRSAECEPDRTRRLLVEIAESARSTLEELHRLLDMLCEDTDATPRDPRDFTSVVDAFVHAGLFTDLDICGARRPLDERLANTATAIITEALSNVARHAPQGHSVVRVRYEPTRLVVEVADDGPGPPFGMAPGFGLQGALERAAALGGTLSLRRGRHGGALMRATLPYDRNGAG